MELQEFGFQYLLRRGEIAEVAEAFAEALEEDYRVNADMFDRTRTTITGNPHPNATMRALEKRLGEGDLLLLHLLTALIAVGTDLVLGLVHFAVPQELLAALGAEYARAEPEEDAAVLAHRLTEPKAEHQKKRLERAMHELERAGY